jgi:hypothetical protein
MLYCMSVEVLVSCVGCAVEAWSVYQGCCGLCDSVVYV